MKRFYIVYMVFVFGAYMFSFSNMTINEEVRALTSVKIENQKQASFISKDILKLFNRFEADADEVHRD